MNQTGTEKHTKKKRKWLWLIVVLLAVVAVVLVTQKKAPSEGFNVRTAVAETGSLSITVVGTGNLEYDEAVDIEIPSGIVIDEIPIESGASIATGDTLATFDPLSIKQEIKSVQGQLDALYRQISAARETPETESIKAVVPGRVKKIYALEGGNALDTYLDSGALMLLSSNEKMAVAFEGSAGLTVGDEIVVVLENGNTEEGTVEEAVGEKYTVTLTDDGPKLGEAVTIQNEDGSVLGKGNLHIHQPVKVISSYGDIKTIHVSENEKVRIGETLITLEGIPVSTEYEQLLADRDELLEKLDALLELSKSNTLAAEMNGVILNVNIVEGTPTGGTAPDPTATTGNQAFATSQASPSAMGDIMATAFTAASDDNVVLTVNVDELDILSIEKGMNVDITFDAVPDKTFTGKITEVSDSAVAGAGIAKYPVKVVIPRDEVMRAGMNATATILVEKRENVLLIPVVALQETGGRVYVYTEQNAKTGELSGETDIITGNSDGVYVEVLDGLKSSSTLYYRAAANEFMERFYSQDRFGGNYGYGGNGGE